MWTGRRSHVVLVKAAVPDEDIKDLAQGKPLYSFPWASQIVFHDPGETAGLSSYTDLTGQHIITRNGTSYGSDTHPDGFNLYPRRDADRFLPMFEAAVGGGFQAAWAYRANTLIGGL